MKKYLVVLGLAAVVAAPVAFADSADCGSGQACTPSKGQLTSSTLYSFDSSNTVSIQLPADLPQNSTECHVVAPANPPTSGFTSTPHMPQITWSLKQGDTFLTTKQSGIGAGKGETTGLYVNQGGPHQGASYGGVKGKEEGYTLIFSPVVSSGVGTPTPDPYHYAIWCNG